MSANSAPTGSAPAATNAPTAAAAAPTSTGSTAAAAPTTSTTGGSNATGGGGGAPASSSSRANNLNADGFRAIPSASVVTTEPCAFAPTLGRGNERPCLAMSLSLVKHYKQVNETFFRKKRLEGPGPHHNDGYDDRDGHYIVIPGEEIMERYAVQEVLGRGSFGTVVKCLDSKRLETVAVKITRTGRTFRNQAKQEIDILLKLSRIPGLAESYIARLLKVFEWKGHLCLAFDLLSFNLFQLIQCTQFKGVSLDLTRKFAYQILQVLRVLQNHDPPIIHCDIKPENVLLRSNQRSGIRVIDFGSSCYENRRLYRYIQSRFYRSPEVILGLDYTTAIDRWSLGAMLVELHTGIPLFDGRTEAQQLQRIVGLCGPIPAPMVSESSKKAQFFHRPATPQYPSAEPSDRAAIPHSERFTSEDGEEVAWWLLTPPAPRHVRDLNVILGTNAGGPDGRRAGQAGHEPEVYAEFVDFVKGLLIIDPVKRMSVDDALAHPFMAPAVRQQMERMEQVREQREQQQQQPQPPSSAPAAGGGGTGGESGGSGGAAPPS